MPLRDEARAAYEGEHTAATRAALIDTIGDPQGFTSALTVEHQAIGPTFTFTVFTDGDLHLGSQVYTDGRDPWIGLTTLGADGKWTKQAIVKSLSHLGEILPTYDPVDETAGA